MPDDPPVAGPSGKKRNRPVGPGRAARELALQLLVQADMNPQLEASGAKLVLEELTGDEDLSTEDDLAAHADIAAGGDAETLRRRAWRLFAGVTEVREDLDGAIAVVARNWSLKRMAATDRNVLRLGLFELLHTGTAPKVVLNEAIELARRFGDKNSPQFVNGLLDRLLPDAKRPPSRRSPPGRTGP